MSRREKLARPKSLTELKAIWTAVENGGRASSILGRLDLIAGLIQEKCPETVHSAIAFGTTIGRLTRPDSFQRSTDGVAYLIVTKLERMFPASQILAEEVFGPATVESGILADIHIWTMAELKAARLYRHQIWTKAFNEGVTIFGEQLLGDM